MFVCLCVWACECSAHSGQKRALDHLLLSKKSCPSSTWMRGAKFRSWTFKHSSVSLTLWCLARIAQQVEGNLWFETVCVQLQVCAYLALSPTCLPALSPLWNLVKSKEKRLTFSLCTYLFTVFFVMIFVCFLLLFDFYFIIYILRVFLPLYVYCTIYVSGPQGQRRRDQIPKAVVTESYEASCRCWELNPGPQQEQQMFLILSQPSRPCVCFWDIVSLCDLGCPRSHSPPSLVFWRLGLQI